MKWLRVLPLFLLVVFVSSGIRVRAEREEEGKRSIRELVQALREVEIDRECHHWAILGDVIPPLLRAMREDKPLDIKPHEVRPLLQKDDWDIRIVGAGLLAKLQGADAAPDVLKLLKKACKQKKWPQYFDSGWIPSPRILQRHEAEEADAVRDGLATILIEMGEDTKPRLKKALKSRTKNYTYYVAIALGRMKEPDAVPTLIKAAGKSKSGFVREHATEILRDLNDKRATSVLIKALEDTWIDDYAAPRVSMNAAEALGNMKAVEAVPALLKALGKNPDNAQLSIALAKIGDERAIPVLIDLLRNGELCRQRSYAASALGDMGNRDKKVISALREALSDPEEVTHKYTLKGEDHEFTDFPVREAAKKALEKLKAF